jgi:ElaB/YqjD/DUF883 family membrane-anchored ribosome-binding protein
MLNKNMNTENQNTGVEVEEVEEVEEEAEEVVEEVEEVAPEPTPEPKKRAESQIERLKRELKEAKEKLATSQTTGLSLEDTLAITTSGIHKEDLPEVIEYAKYKGIPLSEAMESSYVKTIQRENAQIRAKRASTIASPNRTGGQVDDVARAVARYKKDGTLPEGNPALISKILDAIK